MSTGTGTPTSASSAIAVKAMTAKKTQIKHKPVLRFPTELTEEELMLKSKYEKLKKKKLALQKLKNPPRPEPDPMPTKISRGTKIEARDAREIAKKLIKSGNLVIDKPPEVGKEGFKRPLGLTRRLTSDCRTVSSYHPFSSTVSEESEEDTAKEEISEIPTTPKVKSLYDSFVAACSAGNTASTSRTSDDTGSKYRRGNTIFVGGNNISSEFLWKNFERFGKIVHISAELDKQRAFVTFESAGSSEEAINALNGMIVDGMHVKVTFARMQPMLDQFRLSSAANSPQKSSPKPKRDVVTYNDDLFN